MPSHGTVLATLPKALLAYLGAFGHDQEEIARAAGIDTEAWADDDARIPREEVDALFDLAVERTGDGALGLRFAMVLPPGNAGVFEIVAASARSLEEGLGHVCRYWRLLNDGVDLALVRSDREAVLRLTI